MVPKDSARGEMPPLQPPPPRGLSSARPLPLPWGEALGPRGAVGRAAGMAALYVY